MANLYTIVNTIINRKYYIQGDFKFLTKLTEGTKNIREEIILYYGSLFGKIVFYVVIEWPN